MLAWLGCFFTHLSYSLRTARLDSSLFMLATQTYPMQALRDFPKHNHAELAMLQWAKPLFSWVVHKTVLGARVGPVLRKCPWVPKSMLF
jgi:hypothetical protein